jgi:DNA-binding MarR family transcriptional regulator
VARDTLVDRVLELSRALRWLTHPVRRGEITPEQYWLLYRLSRTECLSVGELAVDLGVGQSATTTACKRLERQGLVTRARDRADERKVLVALTAEGRHRIDAWRERRRRAAERLLSVLGDEEQAVLDALLERVLSRLGAQGDVARP